MFQRAPRDERFPAGFLFGVGNSDHQTEAFDPQYEDINDLWERRRALTPRGRATDFWHRYREDIALAQGLGCKLFRFSLAWSRLEPSPGVYNDEAFAHYRDVIEAIRMAGMAPMVTLHHFTWPIHVEERGGIIAEDFPAIFARYVEEVVARLGDAAQYWITFNEPNILSFGYIKPWWEADYMRPPGLSPMASVGDQAVAINRLIRNLFLAHTAARTIIKAANPAAKVSANAAILGLPVWLQRLVDRNITRIRTQDDLLRGARRYTERALLERGEVDLVVATLTKTTDRERQVDFSETYYVAGQLLLVKADSAIGGPADVRGRQVAVVKTSTAESGIHTLIPGARAYVVPDYATALDALERGQVVALLADDTILLGLIARDPARYRLAGMPLTKEPYGVALTKGNPDLLAAVNEALDRFDADGGREASLKRNLPDRVPARRAAARTPTTLVDLRRGDRSPDPAPPSPRGARPPRGGLLRRIQKRGYLIVAVKSDVPGFGFHDAQTGAWEGFEIDLARAIADYIFGDPTKIRFRATTTQQRLPLLRSILRVFDPVLRAYAALSTFLTTNWWYLGMAGQLSELLCPPQCVGQFDFIGIDYYWGINTLGLNRLQRLLASLTSGRYDDAPVTATLLYNILRSYGKLFPGKELVIVENGSVESASGILRADYLRQHLQAVQRACRDDVRVAAYLYWSITTNREWGSKLEKGSDFGLYAIALDDDPALRRIPTAAAATYRDIIARGRA